MATSEAVSAEADGSELTEVQTRRLAQIQLTGVVVLSAGSLLAGILRREPWAWVGLLVALLIVILLGWLAARVQHRPFPQLAWQAAKEAVAEAHEKPKERLHRFGHRE